MWFRLKQNREIRVGNALWGAYSAPKEKYPSYIREYGIAIVYQRFRWKGIHAMSALQKYLNEDNRKIQPRLYRSYPLLTNGQLLKFR